MDPKGPTETPSDVPEGANAVASEARPAAATAGRFRNLFGMDRERLRAEFASIGEKPFRADQIMQWIYRRGVDDFGGMTNISKDLRARLESSFVVRPPELLTEQKSIDGTRKWVLKVGGGQAIETVFIPEKDRGTLCISSQVGCAMDCAFCSTAQQGLNRNLDTAEIVAQVWFAAKALGGDFQNERVISNVVFMGMGEPLANYNAVLPAVKILQDDFGFGLSKRRVTVSTSGLVPFIDRLREDVDTALAVSLHAPNDDLRNVLVPINKKYPVAELMDACRRYTAQRDHKMHIVYEYVMLDGVNDSPALARDLAKLLNGMPAKVNLIPFNPFPETRFKRSRPEAIEAFANILRAKNIIATTRKTRGDDIDAACGQLVGKVLNKQKRRLGDIPVRAG
ncbi:23S rRNA m(2)A-2503 methyltransferase [Panacagrimonas perspica]|uniref:Dual-specificity RNA methyltransferase RlmN n=2 Tax=Panacagrimonas perspica TaxID=381431 RepID=A0A4V3F484_9GAMM|nr:23S rRNA (adenine(2503)-C(2))-methyltransferase RlmN [Panacagrimonas perspica]TDU24306.1 23S rRNA m(2)A-2503 methyltransferase [Panacagrimonas perspica]